VCGRTPAFGEFEPLLDWQYLRTLQGDELWICPRHDPPPGASQICAVGAA
jgi:hypothetical protein